MDAIIDTVAQAISHVAATASASLEEIARSNITRSINRLSAVNESETVILDGVDNLISHVNLSAQFGKAAKLCTSEAIWKLKGMNGSIAVDEYLFMTARGLKTCLETEFEIRELVWIRDPFLIFLLAFFIMSMVFGPAWPLLLPLRAMGFGSLGVRAGSLMAWVQSCLYGGYTPAAGWFAWLTWLGMVRRFFLVPWAWIAAILGIAASTHDRVAGSNIASGFGQTVLA